MAGPCHGHTVAASGHRKFMRCALDHPWLARTSPWSAPTVIAMQSPPQSPPPMNKPRMNTLWAAMLTAWLAAGQTAPPTQAAEPADAPRPADEATPASPEVPPR
jgi:hypothetical protein